MKRLISNILRLGVIAVIAAVLFVPSAASAQYSEETTTTVASGVQGGGANNGGTGVSGGGLPRTGSSNTIPLVTIGSMLLVGGGLLVFGVRRQRNTV